MLIIKKKSDFNTEKDFYDYLLGLFGCPPIDDHNIDSKYAVYDAAIEVVAEGSDFKIISDFPEENQRNEYAEYLTQMAYYKNEDTTPAQKNLAGTILYASLNKYVHSQLYKQFPTYTKPGSGYREDEAEMSQESWTTILKEMGKYKSDYSPTTFIRPHVSHEGTEYISRKSNRSTHNNNITRKVKAELDRLCKERNLTAYDITDQELSENTGLSLLQVSRARDMANEGTQQLLDEVTSDRTFDSPEDQAIAAERAQVLEEALSILTPIEREIVEARSNGLTYKAIANELHDSLVEYGAKPTKTTVEALYQMAISKMVSSESTEFGGIYYTKLSELVNLHDIHFTQQEAQSELDAFFEMDDIFPPKAENKLLDMQSRDVNEENSTAG